MDAFEMLLLFIEYAEFEADRIFDAEETNKFWSGPDWLYELLFGLEFNS